MTNEMKEYYLTALKNGVKLQDLDEEAQNDKEIVNYAWKCENSRIIKALGISKPIGKFLIKNGIDLHNIPDSLKTNINGTITAQKSDFDYTLIWNNSVYTNKIISRVYINDIIGSLSLVGEDIDLLRGVSLCYNNNDEYGERNLDKLQEDFSSNIDYLLQSEIPVNLSEIDGKYYIKGDGNHRVLYLKLAYLILKEKYKNSPKQLREIEEKFNIKAEVHKKSGYNKIDKVCYCLTKCHNDDIEITFYNEPDKLAQLTITKKIIEIKNEDEFISHFENYLSLLDKNSDKYIELTSRLFKIGYYNQSKQTNNIDEEVDRIMKEINDKVYGTENTGKTR